MIKVITNPDEDFAKEVRAKIKENNGHCACAVTFNEDNKCVCKEFKKQIKDGIIGECHCGLYKIVNSYD